MFPSIRFDIGYMPEHNFIVLKIRDELPGMKFELLLDPDGARSLAESLKRVADKHSPAEKGK